MKLLYYSGWLLTRTLSKAFFRICISGREHIPKTGGFILASNHISYFDPPLVGSWSTREVYFFAKSELFDHWLLGPLLRHVNAFPVKRGTIDRQALEMAVAAVKEGYGLTIFPEGTRSKGDGFLNPKPGIGMIARQARSPIVPCYVHGANRLKECFWGRQRLSIRFGEPISAEWITSSGDGKESIKRIAQHVMKRIFSLKEITLKCHAPANAGNNRTENIKKAKKSA